MTHATPAHERGDTDAPRLPQQSPAVVHMPAGNAVRPCPFPCTICRRAGRQGSRHPGETRGS